jgi:hypothetical protein
MRALALLALSACAAGWEEAPVEARERFVRDFTCPEERVLVAEQPPQPPADVRDDPARMALWQERFEDVRFEHAEGCGHDALYRCRRSGRYGRYMLCQPGQPE